MIVVIENNPENFKIITDSRYFFLSELSLHRSHDSSFRCSFKSSFVVASCLLILLLIYVLFFFQGPSSLSITFFFLNYRKYVEKNEEIKNTLRIISDRNHKLSRPGVFRICLSLSLWRRGVFIFIGSRDKNV